MTFSKKIATLNINAINSDVKKGLLRDFVFNNDIDVLFLQEVAFENFCFISSHVAFVNISEDNKGTAILLRKNIEFSNVLMNPNGRITSIHIGKLNFINVYAHSGSKYRKERDLLFSQDIVSHISCEQSNIILGDFNCILLKQDSNGVVKNFCPALQNLVSDLQLRDVEKSVNKKTCFTFFRGESMSRLDRIYGTELFIRNVISFESLATPVSDHHALILKFEIENNSDVTVHGRGYWKINPSLLYDEDIKSGFKNVIREVRARNIYNENICQWWCHHLKPKAKAYFKTKSFEINSMITASKSFLYGCLKEITEKQREGVDISREISFVKSKLMEIEQSRLTNLKLKTSSECVLEDEKINMFQVSKRLTKSNSNQSFKLEINGKVTSHTKDIKTALENHFETLFAKDSEFNPGVDNVLNYIRKRLSNIDREKLTAPIEMAELELALKQASKKKSPGPDGLTYEFYVTFFDELKVDMLKFFNHYHSMPVSVKCFSEGIITLIPKKQESFTIHDKRPINMLNADYKLFTKILFNRLQPILDTIIENGQTACLAEKSCTTNLRILRNIMLKSNTTKTFKGAIVSIDLEKAFDRVDHVFLWAVLEKFGFPPEFIECIKRLYANASSKVLFNGFLTKAISVQSSVRQGCPLSMSLFILYIEPLIRMLSEGVRGCFIDNNFIKVVVYADDINIFIRDDSEFDTVLQLINYFSIYAKIKLNLNKSYYMRLNNCRTGPHLLKEADSLNILGVELHQNFVETVKSNYSKLIHTIKFLISIHSRRYLNIFQKTWILNYLVLSKLWYLAQVYPPDNSHIAELRTVCRNFLFKGVGLFRVNMNQLYLDIERGGLSLIDVEIKVKALFIKGILQPSQVAGRDNFMLSLQKSALLTRNTKEWIREATNVMLIKDITTCKQIYNFFISQRNITPKITIKFPNLHWEVFWQNMNKNFISSNEKHTLFLMFNDIIPSKEKLFKNRVAGTVNNLCVNCGNIDTTRHRVKLCLESKLIWEWILQTIKEKLKINLSDPEDILFRVINNDQHQSKVALWLTCLGISYNLQKNVKSVSKFKETIYELRWTNRLNYKKSFGRWINVL